MRERTKVKASTSTNLVVFSLDEHRYALHLSAVERVTRAVDVIPLPKAPAIVLGIVNVQGGIVPVINVRRRFGLPERGIDLNDRLILAHTARRRVMLVADAIAGVVEYPEERIVPANKFLPGTEYLDGVLKLEDGIVLIHDLETFLSLEEEQALDSALKKAHKR